MSLDEKFMPQPHETKGSMDATLDEVGRGQQCTFCGRTPKVGDKWIIRTRGGERIQGHKECFEKEGLL